MILDQLLHIARKKAYKLPLNCNTKYILFSDLHKGNNSYADDFKKNIRIYKEALHHYYKNDFTYIELGDGIELWENKKMKPIIKAHQVIFDLLKDFHTQKRLYLLYGNHDMVLMYPFMVRFLLGSVFKDLKYYESVILETDDSKKNILLLHGHQADYLNYLFWWFFRFMVRYVWKPLQYFGINDPTSPAKNFKERIKVERNMEKWVVKNKQPVIFGHTHRPIFPEKPKTKKEPIIPMFNTGSCVHPNAIIGIEIKDMQISMVKWIEDEVTKKTKKIVIEGPVDIEEYW
jgi:UDP-2,3-diacylglucosamine pyrophosphatase LpxH